MLVSQITRQAARPPVRPEYVNLYLCLSSHLQAPSISANRDMIADEEIFRERPKVRLKILHGEGYLTEFG
jgi:hypothetical protein